MLSHASNKDIPESWYEVISTSCFWQSSFWSPSKKKRKESSSCHALLWMLSCFDLAMLLLTKSAKDKNFQLYNWFPTFWKQKEEIYYSLSLFICYYSWHCSLRIFVYSRGGCPLCLKKVLVKFYFRSSFLERVILCEPFFERFPYLL